MFGQNRAVHSQIRAVCSLIRNMCYPGRDMRFFGPRWSRLVSPRSLYLGRPELAAAQGDPRQPSLSVGRVIPASVLGQRRPPASRRQQVTRRPRADCSDALHGMRQGLAGPWQAASPRPRLGRGRTASRRAERAFVLASAQAEPSPGHGVRNPGC